DNFRSQSVVRGRKRRRSSRMQQLRCVCVGSLYSQQYVESRRTGGRNRHGKILEASANWSWFESIGSESAPLDPEFLVLARTAPARNVRSGTGRVCVRL